MANAERQNDQPTSVEPTEQHRWLQRLEGTWDIDGEAEMGNGEVSKWTAVETVRKVGELWMVAESIGEMPGAGPATNLTTLGYDPRTNKFVGTFVSTMMTHLWIYEGQLDDRKKALTLTAHGPDMSEEGKLAKYEDVYELVSDTHRTMTSRTLGRDGKWTQFMVAHYRRR